MYTMAEQKNTMKTHALFVT